MQLVRAAKRAICNIEGWPGKAVPDRRGYEYWLGYSPQLNLTNGQSRPYDLTEIVSSALHLKIDDIPYVSTSQ
jgi:hypothetical protein